MIQEVIHRKVIEAFNKAIDTGILPDTKEEPRHQIQTPKHARHGDYSTNIAMVMQGALKTPPKKTAEVLRDILKQDPMFNAVEVAGPGFLNFFISKAYWQNCLIEINNVGKDYGRTDVGHGKKVLLEYVSANPTGPLHVGHGRGAAIGDSLARILAFAGFKVTTEYYINDAGNQMDTLGKSVYLRYQELLGKKTDFPNECYQGQYIVEIAKKIKDNIGDRYKDAPLEECLEFFTKRAVESIHASIEEDLRAFGCTFHNWFSEKTLHQSGFVEQTLEGLKAKGYIYEKDGALWFRSSEFGDEKDRVVKRSNGVTTYFAADIAYHSHKIQRGFDLLVDVWGADHHGYVPRLKAAIQALGKDPHCLKVILVQLVNLIEGGEPKAMSTRAGEFITLREVLDDVGKDVARFMFLMRRQDSHLDFDLDLARKKSQENPVYYVQYAHARISSVFKKADERGIRLPEALPDVSRLEKDEEIAILKKIEAFPKHVAASALSFEPHTLSYYLTELASLFHGYYNKHRLIQDDLELTLSRLYLVKGVQQVLRNGLELLGVEAPEEM